MMTNHHDVGKGLHQNQMEAMRLSLSSLLDQPVVPSKNVLVLLRLPPHRLPSVLALLHLVVGLALPLDAASKAATAAEAFCFGFTDAERKAEDEGNGHHG